MWKEKNQPFFEGSKKSKKSKESKEIKKVKVDREDKEKQVGLSLIRKEFIV